MAGARRGGWGKVGTASRCRVVDWVRGRDSPFSDGWRGLTVEVVRGDSRLSSGSERAMPEPPHNLRRASIGLLGVSLLSCASIS